MGTNYYAVTPPCATPCLHCSQSREIHICKSLTSFRGWVRAYPEQELPLGPIGNWQEWKDVLRSVAVTHVVNEYGETLEVEEFIAHVEETDSNARCRQHRWLVEHCYPLDRDWLDPDGFSFHDGEFS